MQRCRAFASGFPFPQSEVISWVGTSPRFSQRPSCSFPACPPGPPTGDAKSILDKGIKALGGEEKLAKAEAYSWKSKGTINFNGNENEFNGEVTVKGLDHFRREFGNDQFNGVIVLAGDKGWRKFGDNSSELEGDGLANEKRRVYLEVIPTTLVALKGKGFKYEAGGEEKVGDKPAVILKVTGPDGKDFTLSFDKESGLPVKMVAKVIGFQGQENNQETTFSRLQGLRRDQEGHQDRGQARRRDVSDHGGHRVQGPGQGGSRDIHRAQVTLSAAVTI